MLIRFVLLLCLVSIFKSVQADVWSPSNLVIVISMDGMRHDYPDKASFPGFKRMELEGLRVQKMIPTFPSNTFPGHVSLATGARPEVHGIIDNDFYDKKLRKSFDKMSASEWLQAEPIWISAERQGKRAAVYYWLGSEGSWQGRSASYFKAPFKSTLSEGSKVKQIIQWMDLPKEKRPSLIMSYWHGADSEGHNFGPSHLLVKKKIEQQDKFLQDLQRAIDERNAWDYVSLIVVSDHGMTEKGEAIDISEIIQKGKSQAYIKKSNAVVHLNFKTEKNKTDAFNFLKQQPNIEVYSSNNMPKAISVYHNDRSGDLVLIAKKGFYFSSGGLINTSLEKGKANFFTGGMHGLPPDNPDMATIFLAQGRGIKKASSIFSVNMLDVAPSIASLLGIAPPLQAEGKSFLPN